MESILALLKSLKNRALATWLAGLYEQTYAGVDFPQSGIYEFGYCSLLKHGRPSWGPGDKYIAIFDPTNLDYFFNCKIWHFLVIKSLGSGSGNGAVSALKLMQSTTQKKKNVWV